MLSIAAAIIVFFFGSASRCLSPLTEALYQFECLNQAPIVQQVGGRLKLTRQFITRFYPIEGYYNSFSPDGFYQNVIPPTFTDDFYFVPAAGMVWMGYLCFLVSRVALWCSLLLTSSRAIGLAFATDLM
jgi:hypothetical protein